MNQKEWNSLTVLEKRVAVAKDIIESVEKDFYIPTEGIYVHYNQNFKTKKEVSLKDVLRKKQVESCTVCALGSCFLSIIKFQNNYITKELADHNFTLDITSKEQGKERQILRTVFTDYQLGLIESAFERTTTYASRVINDENLIEQTLDFGYQYFDSKERLIAIMKNIIKNQGFFKP